MISSNEVPVFSSLKEVVVCVHVNRVMVDRVSCVMVSQQSMLVLMVVLVLMV